MKDVNETVSEKLDKAIKAAKGRITRDLTPEDSPKATQAVLNLAQAKTLYESCQGPEVDEELMVVLGRVRPNLAPTDMMKSTQAVLNLMHAKEHFKQTQPEKVQKTKN